MFMDTDDHEVGFRPRDPVADLAPGRLGPLSD
jgi:hypothetical protein